MDRLACRLVLDQRRRFDAGADARRGPRGQRGVGIAVVAHQIAGPRVDRRRGSCRRLPPFQNCLIRPRPYSGPDKAKLRAWPCRASEERVHLDVPPNYPSFSLPIFGAFSTGQRYQVFGRRDQGKPATRHPSQRAGKQATAASIASPLSERSDLLARKRDRAASDGRATDIRRLRCVL